LQAGCLQPASGRKLDRRAGRNFFDALLSSGSRVGRGREISSGSIRPRTLRSGTASAIAILSRSTPGQAAQVKARVAARIPAANLKVARETIAKLP
jgi:hypothetical protein